MPATDMCARPAQPIAPAAFPAGAVQPNELDLRRIVRALDERARYRYVEPRVQAVDGGYRIVSPCCSRNIDEAGGDIDIARIEYAPAFGEWHLYRKDHQTGGWVLHACLPLIGQALAELCRDPQRVFWP